MLCHRNQGNVRATIASVSHGSSNCSISYSRSVLRLPAPPLLLPRSVQQVRHAKGGFIWQRSYAKRTFPLSRIFHSRSKISRKEIFTIPRCRSPSKSDGSVDDSSGQGKATFGYSRKDVLLIGVGIAVIGVGLKSGLELFGVDPLQAGNVVQLVIVLGLTVGWISTYIFRVANKEMTYAQQLREYEKEVMQKRLDSLTEAELEALLEQVEEEKSRLRIRKQANQP